MNVLTLISFSFNCCLSCEIKTTLYESESTISFHWQTCMLPLSSVLLLSQYWMVNSLIKRLELLFLGVFAWPKASRIQLTWIFYQNKGNITSESEYPMHIFFILQLMNGVLLPFHSPPLDVNMHPLCGTSVIFVSSGWSESELTQISTTQRWLHQNTALAIPGYPLQLTDWVQSSESCVKHHQHLTIWNTRGM